METSQELAVQLEAVRVYPTTQPSIAILKTTRGDGYLPIGLSMAEAQELEYALAGRDVAHDLALQLLAALGGRIEQVVVQSVGEQNDSAILTLVRDKQRRSVAARTGYALVLAVCAGAPLFVTSEVVTRVGLMHDLSSLPAPAPVEAAPPPASIEAVPAQAPHTFAEMTWSFLLETLFGPHAPLDQIQPHDGARTEYMPAQAIELEGQPMHAIRLPAREPAWLVVRPELSTQITKFVESAQQIRQPEPAADVSAPAALTPVVQQQVDELFARAQNDIAPNELLMMLLMDRSGQIVTWRGQESYEDALRLGLTTVYRHQLEQHVDRLVQALTKDTPVDDSKYRSVRVTGWIDRPWMLVAGFGEGESEAMQQRLNRLQQELEALLPAAT